MSGWFFVAIIMLVAFFISVSVCFALYKIKNLSISVCWFALLFVLGIIIVALLPARFVQCRNCGYKFNPCKGNVCPVCGKVIQYFDN